MEIVIHNISLPNIWLIHLYFLLLLNMYFIQNKLNCHNIISCLVNYYCWVIMALGSYFIFNELSLKISELYIKHFIQNLQNNILKYIYFFKVPNLCITSHIFHFLWKMLLTYHPQVFLYHPIPYLAKLNVKIQICFSHLCQDQDNKFMCRRESWIVKSLFCILSCRYVYNFQMHFCRKKDNLIISLLIPKRWDITLLTPCIEIKK